MRNRKHWLLRLTAALVLGAAGCGKSPSAADPKADPRAQVTVGADTPATDGALQLRAVNFEQSFDDAVITEVLEGHHLPPDLTFAGKKTGPLRVAVETSWPRIKLTDATGKPIAPVLHLETGAGRIELALRPEIAPNHVRHFLALAHAGFYDGLQFERVVHQEAEIDGAKNRLDLLIGGCPTGTGDDGYGHIGYFVRSETQADLKHEAGTVGFWHEEDPDSAGCRFYIALGPTPILDGRFTIIGKVTKGLEVVQRIAAAPVQNPDTSPENEMPLKPVAIRKVTIAPDVMEK